MATVSLAVDGSGSARIEHGAGLLRAALEAAGHDVVPGGASADPAPPGQIRIVVSPRGHGGLVRALEEAEVLCYYRETVPAGGFALQRLRDDLIVVAGTGDSGALYGCQELARRVRDRGTLPDLLDEIDGPAFALRGPALALQKTHIEPPRSTYDYPVTPDRFGWFYDRDAWLRLLDRLLAERANVIYLWTGHPFASFVATPGFPEAVEVTAGELARNAETLHWLIREADSRGIRVVLTFYNIHLPLPFAEKHGLGIHQSAPSPLVQRYYRACVAEFARTFPQAGYMICLGEALRGDLYGEEWLTGTLLPAINEGRAAAAGDGEAACPPVIIRSHAVDARTVLPSAEKVYPVIYTEAKFNGESLTTYTPRGYWQELHRDLSTVAEVHIVNVHILANLEPFRWGAPSFVQRCMQAARRRLGARGLHLYPLCFWDWPYSPDTASPRLEQIDRDWLWYAAWFRYAWNPDRDPGAERRHWAERLAGTFGLSGPGAESVLDAFEDMGSCAPRLLRRLGITEGNRQTWSLGMTLAQLAVPDLFMPWKDLWESHSPRGERLGEYVDRDLAGEPHVGETPPDVLADAERAARRAVDTLDAVAGQAGRNRDELDRVRADARAIWLLASFYRAKTGAAAEVVRYRRERAGQTGPGGAAARLDRACDLLDESVASYRRLAALTSGTYEYANSMQTAQRKVPFPDGSVFRHWTDCLPEYERERDAFRAAVQRLSAGAPAERAESAAARPYTPAEFRLLSPGAETYRLEAGGSAFTDGDLFIVRVAPEITGLTGIRFSQVAATADGMTVDVELAGPAQVLVGYFASDDPQWLRRPSLEVDAHAEERGALTPLLTNAVEIYTYPPVDVYALRYEAGRHTLAFGKGAYLLLGAVSADEDLIARNVAGPPWDAADMSWLTA